MNIFDIIYTGLSPYFFAGFIKKYKSIKVAIDYLNCRFHSTVQEYKMNKPAVILHGASIGETKSLLTLKTALERASLKTGVVITTATHTAYNLLHSQNGLSSSVFYMPFDFNSKIKRFLKRLKPSVLVIAEQEIWPNLITNASKEGTHIIFVNFRIKPQKAFIYNLGFYKNLLKTKIEKFFCINDFTIEKLMALGVENSKIEKIDNLKYIPYLNKPLPRNLNKLNIVSLLSIHKGEEYLLMKICEYLHTKYGLKFVVIPRHINYSEYFYKFFNQKFKCIICKDFDILLTGLNQAKYDMFILNRFGLVGRVLDITKYTILGGTYINLGGHNILEPLFYSNKVLVGKHYQNIKDEVEKGANLDIVYKEFIPDRFIEYTDVSKRCEFFFKNIKNPVDKILNTILPLLEQT